jgi:hypothetical protein
MGIIGTGITTSVDGHITGPNDRPEKGVGAATNVHCRVVR